MEIRDLESLLLKKFKPKSKILDLSTEEFLLPHENVLSKVLKVRATVKETGQENLTKLNLVLKFLDDEEFQKFRAVHFRTFDVEILFYEKIVPIYDQVMKDVFPDRKKVYPEFFGARLSLNEDAKFRDDDVAILLEDLAVDNYQMIRKRLQGKNKFKFDKYIFCRKFLVQVWSPQKSPQPWIHLPFSTLWESWQNKPVQIFIACWSL